MDTTFYLAICEDCYPRLPQPFYDEAKRDEWAGAHRTGTGHEVTCETEVRPGR